jgi:hypothetical protein
VRFSYPQKSLATGWRREDILQRAAAIRQGLRDWRAEACGKLYKRGKQMKFAIAILALTASVASALACSDAELARLMRNADQWNRRAQVLVVLADNLRASHFEAYFADRRAGWAAAQLGVCLCEAMKRRDCPSMRDAFLPVAQ